MLFKVKANGNWRTDSEFVKKPFMQSFGQIEDKWNISVLLIYPYEQTNLPPRTSLEQPTMICELTSSTFLSFEQGISWTLYNLALYPEHQLKCLEEVNEVYGKKQELKW